MITASNAKISWVGPSVGSNDERIAEERAGERRGREAIAAAMRVDAPRVDADELGGLGVVGRRAHLRGRARVRQEQLQPAEQRGRRRRR